ncbi:MAG: hypothetical protein HC897_05810 [Thermoanaerobaculia bacterium]|nr:hypothetical protein [Thermoanaerobaculia bacterium]
MSTVGDSVATLRDEPAVTPLDWGLMRRQLAGILRLELVKSLLSRRALALYFLAFAPVALVLVWSLTPFPKQRFDGPADAMHMYVNLLPAYLQACVFLSAVFLFTNLFRADILERSLHYYLLTPLRREVLVAGKYLAALIASSAVFSLGTALFFIFTCWPWGLGELFRYLFNDRGLGHLLGYELVVVLACAGYGALFLLVGQLFRNPVIPAALLFVWEGVNFLLPPLLKKISVIHYLRSIYPIPVNEGPFATPAEPTPAWLSVPGLLIFTGLVLTLAAWRMRRMDVSYGGE